MSCTNCGDTGKIRVVKDTHDDISPCPECTPPVSMCRGRGGRQHVPITYRAVTCPLCEALKGPARILTCCNFGIEGEPGHESLVHEPTCTGGRHLK